MNKWMKIILSLLVYCSCSATLAQDNFPEKLAHAAETLTQDKVTYDPSYVRINYPNGDVPSSRGVCTDVIIRAYRKMGTDLQKEVHEDMAANFQLYPKNWGLSRPDKNIDHRRVPNLMVFFARHGVVKKITENSGDYLPGDIVCWNLGGGVTHIGMAVNKRSADGKRPLIIHNIGGGQVFADCLFDYEIIGHYTFRKKN
jgi:uncharacterized protein